jgi:hypothetical protein
MIVFTYVVLVFLILRFSVTLFNFLSNPKLGHYGKKFDDKVSIVIYPASHDSEQLQQSIAAQDYKNIEVLIADSQESLAVTTLNASGRYLLFIDSTSVIKKGLINSLIYRAKVFDLKFIVLIPNKTFRNIQDYLLLPVADFVVLNIFPLRLVRLLNLPSLAAASDRYMFYDAASYRQKDLINGVDNRKVETLLSNGMMVSNRKSSIEETSRELLKIFDGNPLTIGVYLVLLIAGPLVMIFNFELAFSSLPIGLIFLTRIMISFLTKQNPIVNVILHPLQMLALTGLLVAGTFKRLFTSGVHS